MPKMQRTMDEVEQVRVRILKEALQLMNKVGFHDFSMRRLAAQIKATPPTLYSYFRSKDELYLYILTEGFSLLYDACLKAYGSAHDPMDRIQAMVRAYVDFGMNCANFYNLMFTWHVPKYRDYISTPLESVAKTELESALMVTNLFLKAIRECAGNAGMDEEDAGFYLVHFWSTLHGYIAGFNNTMLDYMHNSPISIRERMLGLIHQTFVNEIQSPRKKS